MMHSPSSTNDDASLKLVPAALVKNLRTISCLKVYDFIFKLDSMKLIDVQKIAHNYFYGNDEKISPYKLSYYYKDMGIIVVFMMKKSPSSPILMILWK